MTDSQPPRHFVPAFALAAVFAAVAAWAYYPTVLALTTLWSSDPNYSQGFMVPILALGLVVMRLAPPRPRPEPMVLTGLAVLAIATAFRLAGSYFYRGSLEQFSILVTLAGLVLFAGGAGWLRRVWPAIAILVFMFPIPPTLGGSNLISGLQEVATRSSTFLLQAAGTVAYREGNVILTPSGELGVVEACSGLKMLMVFCALAAVLGFLIPFGVVQKIILVLSAVPLALVCNIIRITVAGLAGESLGSEAGHFVFHDLAGWLMIPMAFLLLAVEVVILAKLMPAPPPESFAS